MKFRTALYLVFCLIVAEACIDTGISTNDQLNAGDKDSSVTPNRFSTVRLADLNGVDRDPDRFMNKTIFLNIWATWCKPCREEMPSIADAIRSLDDSAIHFIIASPETAADVIPFIKEHSYPFDYALILNAEEFDIVALPATIIFNRSGEIVFSEAGYRNWNKPENLDLIKSMMR